MQLSCSVAVGDEAFLTQPRTLPAEKTAAFFICQFNLAVHLQVGGTGACVVVDTCIDMGKRQVLEGSCGGVPHL